jgi:ATP-dependent protease ClpP protease subunit
MSFPPLHHSKITQNFCGSAAIRIAFAAERILIDRNAEMGIHPAIAGVFGNSLAMRKAAHELELATEDNRRWPRPRLS